MIFFGKFFLLIGLTSGLLYGEVKVEKTSVEPEKTKKSRAFQSPPPKDSSNIKTEAEFCFDCPSSEKNRLESLPLNVKSCGLVPHSHNLMEGKLSDYWAQELIGSDLLREELKKTPAPRKRNWISVFDSHIRKHNIMVKNLISDEGAHAVLPELGEGKVRLFKTKFPGDYTKAADIVKADSPSFINNSMGWVGGEHDRNIYEAFQSLSPPSVLVVAASNDYPKKLDRIKNQASKDFHAVVVGSLSPRGFVSTSSQEGEEVHILAPSDDYITSAVSGRYKKFSGTSGATPLVTGSLAGFEWLSGYHPSGEEAKHLLEKTAIPTVHSHEQPQKNGVGMLNSYQLGMLAKRLKRKCGKSSSCFKEEIKKEENYHFNVGEGLYEDVDRAFPACSLEEGQREERQRASCEEKGRVFKKLRQAVLLSPEKRELWEALSCIYREGGFSVNAEGLDRIALSLGSRKELMAGLKKLAEDGDKNVRGHVARVVEKIGGREGFQLLKQLAEDKDRNVRIQAAYAAGEMGSTEGIQLLKQLAEDEEWYVRGQVAHAAGEMGGREGVQLLKQLAEDGNWRVRAQVARVVEKIGGRDGFQLLKKLAEDKDRNVRAQVAYTAGEMGGRDGFQLLKQLAEDEEWYVRGHVARVVGKIGGREGIQLLKQLVEDENWGVRGQVAYAAGEMGGTEGIQLLKQLAEDENRGVRFQVVNAAGEMGGTEGIQLLKQLVEDKDVNVRVLVAHAAGAIGGTEGIQLLKQLAEDKDRNVRTKVVYTAKRMGGREGAVVLEKLSKDPDPYIQKMVNQILH